MNVALGTVVQSWNRQKLSFVAGGLLVLHIGSFLMGIAFAPTLFFSNEYTSSSCHLPPPTLTSSEEADTTSGTWYQGAFSPASSCLPLGDTEEVPLQERVISFRFPKVGDEVDSYSRWNWRLLGSFLLDITFKGSSNIPGVDSKEVEDDDETLDEEISEESNLTYSGPGFTVSELKVDVTLRATLDARPLSIYVGTNASESLGGWRREEEITKKRTMVCTVSKPVQEYVALSEMYPTAQYLCSLSPLLDIQLPGNKSYIVSLEFQKYKPEETKKVVEEEEFESDQNDTMQPFDFSSLDIEQKNETDFGISEEEEFFTISSEVHGHLTLIVESRDYHKAIFYMKCLFMPFVIAALVWFCLKLYLNDLYISIPDRLLVAAALAQIFQDVPAEVLLTQWDSPGLKLYGVVTQIILVTVLQMFWIVYTLDKLARNEPWERNTKYYWKTITFLLMLLIVSALFLAFDKGPALGNAFNNHWSGEVTVQISLGFVFLLAVSQFVLQTYLTCIIFRVLCDLRTRYPAPFPRAARIKMILMYCLAASALTAAGAVLDLAIHLGLHWNPQFYIDPVPMTLAMAGPFVLGMEGLWNLHIISLLILLSRESNMGHHLPGVILPVRYSQCEVTEPEEAASSTVDYKEEVTVMHEMEEVEEDVCVEYRQYQCGEEHYQQAPESRPMTSMSPTPPQHHYHAPPPPPPSQGHQQHPHRNQYHHPPRDPILSHHLYPQICIQDADDTHGQHERICTDRLSWDNDPSTDDSSRGSGPRSCDLDYEDEEDDDEQWEEEGDEEDNEAVRCYEAGRMMAPSRQQPHRRSLNGYQFVQTSYSQSPLPEEEVM